MSPLPAAPIDQAMAAQPGSRTVYIETFGCQMNHSDTEVVLARLHSAGYQRTEHMDLASLVLFNTCAVRDHAEAKVRGRLGALKPIKRLRPELRIALMGCMAQREKDALLSAYPQLDLVVGTDQFVHLPQLLEEIETGRRIAATEFGDFESTLWPAQRAAGINAWVPIMRGCNYNCTYCVVPATRGKEKSRPAEQIEEEVRFASSYVFMNSQRPATPSAHLPDDVPEQVKRERCTRLLDLQLTHQGQHYATLHGQSRAVLVEGPSKNDDAMLCGRSIGNLNIVFPRYAPDGASRDQVIGDLVDIRIARSTSLTLFGDLAPE